MFAWLFPRAQPVDRRRDTFDGIALSDLKRPLREAIVTSRKQAVTAALRRCGEQGLSSPLPSRDQVVARVRRASVSRSAAAAARARSSSPQGDFDD